MFAKRSPVTLFQLFFVLYSSKQTHLREFCSQDIGKIKMVTFVGGETVSTLPRLSIYSARSLYGYNEMRLTTLCVEVKQHCQGSLRP